jgi:hypothetical protein
VRLERRPWKGRRLWKAALKNSSAYGGTERCESGPCNKGDLMRSGDHNLWKPWYKPVSEVRGGAA